MKLNRAIIKDFIFDFEIKEAGLAAIFVSVRCKSRKQAGFKFDENLRLRINGLEFREIPPRRNIQLFNIPASFNGSSQKSGKKTIVLFTSLNKGKHSLALIPKNSAFVEEVEIQELSAMQDVKLSLDKKAEDGNNFPWLTFVLIDLPLSYLSADITIEKRLWDSDDVKIIVDGRIKKNASGGKFKFWILAGSVLKWLTKVRISEQQERINLDINPGLDSGVHYVEFWTDRTPIFHKINLGIKHAETEPEARAARLVEMYSAVIKDAAREFGVDPAAVGAVIHQEQSTNVNFVDTLTDYVGGLFHANTSIGVGQVRVQTAKSLEKIYPILNPLDKSLDALADSNTVRVERLKDPLTNIRYVAAKLKFSLERWEKAGYGIAGKPEILGTLYNIEDVENPVKPNESPKPNNFGNGVKDNYGKVKKLLGL